MNHLGDTNKMVETPRTDAEYERLFGIYQNAERINGPLCCAFENDMRLCGQLERELNAANESFRKMNIHTLNLVDRIRRLENAGDRMEKLLPEGSICDKAVNAWREAKEAKP